MLDDTLKKALISFFFLISCQHEPAALTLNEIDYGIELAQKGELHDAKKTLLLALETKPHDTKLHKEIGHIYYKLHEYNLAKKHLDLVAHDLDPTSHFILGECDRSQDRYHQAIKHYKMSLSQSFHLDTMRSLAWSYYKIKDFDQALKYTLKMKDHNRQDVTSYIIQAQIYMTMKELKTAQRVLEVGFTQVKEEFHPYLQKNLADLALLRQDYKVAFTLYQKVLRQYPMLASGHLGLGRVYLKFKDLKKASLHLEKAILLDPTLKERVASLHEISKLNPTLTQYLKKKKRHLTEYQF